MQLEDSSHTTTTEQTAEINNKSEHLQREPPMPHHISSTEPDVPNYEPEHPYAEPQTDTELQVPTPTTASIDIIEEEKAKEETDLNSPNSINSVAPPEKEKLTTSLQNKILMSTEATDTFRAQGQEPLGPPTGTTPENP